MYYFSVIVLTLLVCEKWIRSKDHEQKMLLVL